MSEEAPDIVLVAEPLAATELARLGAGPDPAQSHLPLPAAAHAGGGPPDPLRAGPAV